MGGARHELAVRYVSRSRLVDDLNQVLGRPSILDAGRVESVPQRIAVLVGMTEEPVVTHRAAVLAGDVGDGRVEAELRLDLLTRSRLIRELK